MRISGSESLASGVMGLCKELGGDATILLFGFSCLIYGGKMIKGVFVFSYRKLPSS